MPRRGRRVKYFILIQAGLLRKKSADPPDHAVDHRRLSAFGLLQGSIKTSRAALAPLNGGCGRPVEAGGLNSMPISLMGTSPALRVCAPLLT